MKLLTKWPKWLLGLRIQIVVMISLAAVPVGLIAISQTNRLAATADENAELALMALSEKAVQHQRLIIQRAFGAAGMLGRYAPELLQQPQMCQSFIGDFVNDSPDYSFAGILGADGIMTCSNVAKVFDFSAYPTWADLAENPRPNVVMNPAAPGSGTSVIVVSLPFEEAGVFAGYISISIPHVRLAERGEFADLPLSGLVDLFTLNVTGDVLTAEKNLESAPALLPYDWEVSELLTQEARSFRKEAQSGREYVYTLVPIEGSPLTILGVWNASRYGDTQLLQSSVPASAFPMIMWLACVVMAVMMLHTLVIRHIKLLREQMADFANKREIPDRKIDASTPNELYEIHTRFRDLTDNILHEEARLEGMVREQNVLAKEVHHRVKNNLQMIASIMNMQIRSAKHPEMVETLERVQDRISSLADVHKDLYTSHNEGRVNVGRLIRRTVQNSIEIGVRDRKKIRLEQDIADVWMFPDQVVPLSLLASEAITNALKYISPEAGDTPLLAITLRQVDDICELTVKNSTGGEVPAGGTGIGSRLIQAFIIKLGATHDVTTEDGMYNLSISFPIAAFELDSLDY